MYRPVLESPKGDDPFMGSSGAEPLKDLIGRLEKAQEDKDVAAVALLLGDAPLGTAQLEEVYQAVTAIKRAGKPVYAYADHLSFGKLALASAASRISVAPVGELMITGMYGSQLHLRGMLDKLQVTPDFLTCGDYKSAGEMFTRTEPSPEAAEMINWLMDSIFDNFVQLIADGRGESAEQVKKWIDLGLYTSQDAAELGIIDAAEFRHDFVAHIKSQHGDDVKLDTRYGKKKKKSVDLSSPLGAFQLWAELLQGSSGKSKKGKDSVAIVYVEGAIVPGRPEPGPFGSQDMAYSDPIRKALDKAAADDSVKAVVLRVNSPGGSAVASEIILQATRRVAAKKPFVVSMGDVAGSGGYYVSCATDTIFANPSTITASIGVVTGKLVTEDMWDSIGVNFHHLKRGENADMFAASSLFSDKQRQTVQEWMDKVYADFKGHVTAARGDRLSKPIDELAGGRVFTGQQALEFGLVDKLGTLDDAIQFAAEKADLKDDAYDVRVVPKPRNILELLMEDLSGSSDDEGQIRVAWQPRSASLWKAVAPYASALQPQQWAALQQAIAQLEIVQQEGVVLSTPVLIWH